MTPKSPSPPVSLRSCRRCGEPSIAKLCQQCLLQHPGPIFRGQYAALFWVLLVGLSTANFFILRELRVSFEISALVGSVAATAEQFVIMLALGYVRTELWVRRGRSKASRRGSQG